MSLVIYSIVVTMYYQKEENVIRSLYGSSVGFFEKIQKDVNVIHMNYHMAKITAVHEKHENIAVMGWVRNIIFWIKDDYEHFIS